MRAAIAAACLLAACRFGFDPEARSDDDGPSIDAPIVPAAPWFDAAWSNRRRLTIDATKVPAGGVTDFPLAVVLTDTHLQANARADGHDILFTAADGVTKLPHELERYASGSI